MFFNIFLNRKKILDNARKQAREILQEAFRRKKKIIGKALKTRESLYNKEMKELIGLEIQVKRQKKEIDSFKEKLQEIEKLLEETKLADFLEYLSHATNGLIGLEKDLESLDGKPFSERIVVETRMMTKIAGLLNKGKEVKERIRVIPYS